MLPKKHVVIIGGGAAGVFAAALLVEKGLPLTVTVLEKTRQLLTKVKISGGGRCNVTHAAFDPRALVKGYPRGHKELLGPFHRFQPKDTVAWFEARGVALKTEEDGRIFPTTDSSQTIIDCLLRTTHAHIRREASVSAVMQEEECFRLNLTDHTTLTADYVILATGSSPQGHALAASLGHTIIPPVPSLFTFNVPSSPLLALSGITVPDVMLTLKDLPFSQRGPLLLTHFGFSGPAALKLSAWAARALHASNYRHELHINWVPNLNPAQALTQLLQLKAQHPTKTLDTANPFSLPQQLWKHLAASPQPLGHTSDGSLRALSHKLTQDTYLIEGKTTHKQEFVTCGGVCLKEVDFRTMQSRKVPRLFFAGEVLDCDGVTGGFNFQNAWTTAFLVAQAITEGLERL